MSSLDKYERFSLALRIAAAGWASLTKMGYLVFSGDTPGQAGTRLVYTQRGQMAGTQSPPSDLVGLKSILADDRCWY